MSQNFPTSLNDGTSLTNNRNTGQPVAPADHNDLANAQIAVETKLGVGASVPTNPGDVLTVTAAGQTAYQAPTGGGGGSSFAKSVAQTGHGLAVGDVVYFNGTNYVKAKAVLGYSGDRESDVIGIVTTVTDANNFIVTLGGLVQGLSGLTAGKVYLLSPTTAGALTTAQPYADAQVQKPVLFAISSTSGYLQIARGIVNVVARPCSRVGINFGYSGLSDTTRIINDLKYLGRYTRKMRMSIPSWDNSAGIANMRALVLIANAMGFETTYGVTAAGTGHNAAYVDNWLTQVDTEAAWAAANNVDIFYIGNEEDWFANIGGITGYTESQIQDKVLAKAATLKGLYPSMKLAYSTAEGEFSQWDAKVGANSNWQYLDHFGINMYNTDFDGTLAYAKSLAFGSKLFLSEWADNQPYPDEHSGGMSDATYRAHILERRKAIEAAGVDAYFFTWDWGGSYGVSGDWGLVNNDNTYKPGFNEIFGIPR